jgi:hypothetical protein
VILEGGEGTMVDIREWERSAFEAHFLPFMMLGCAPPAPSVRSADAPIVVGGELPAGVDLRDHAQNLTPGGFGVIADPRTGQVATIYAASSAFGRLASGEFVVDVPASCPDCVDPSCALPTRTVDITLRQQNTGPTGAPYAARTYASQNFLGPTTTPGTWPSAPNAPIVLSTVGALGVCQVFSYYFDVVELDGDTGDAECVDDAQEPNDAVGDAIPSTGGTDLALCGGNSDFWSFVVPHGHTVSAAVDFVHADGDLDVRLYDGAMALVATSDGTTDTELVADLNDSGAVTTYVLEVLGSSSAENVYDFAVTLDPTRATCTSPSVATLTAFDPSGVSDIAFGRDCSAWVSTIVSGTDTVRNIRADATFSSLTGHSNYNMTALALHPVSGDVAVAYNLNTTTAWLGVRSGTSLPLLTNAVGSSTISANWPNIYLRRTPASIARDSAGCVWIPNWAGNSSISCVGTTPYSAATWQTFTGTVESVALDPYERVHASVGAVVWRLGSIPEQAAPLHTFGAAILDMVFDHQGDLFVETSGNELRRLPAGSNVDLAYTAVAGDGKLAISPDGMLVRARLNPENAATYESWDLGD